MAGTFVRNLSQFASAAGCARKVVRTAFCAHIGHPGFDAHVYTDFVLSKSFSSESGTANYAKVSQRVL